MLKKVSIVFMTCLIMVCLINKLSFIVRPLDTVGAYSQVETFHSLPNNSLQVIAYGSSHTLRGLSSIEMYKKYGIGAYNYGWHWQNMNTTKLFIEDSLQTQSPKVILIDTYCVNRDYEDSELNAEIYYSRYIKNKKALISYLHRCFGNNIERYLEYFIPLLKFHDNWNTLTNESLAKLSIDPTYYKEMGFCPSDAVTKIVIPDHNDLNDKKIIYNIKGGADYEKF